MNAPAQAVAEIQGLYGAFSFPEKLLQKIWWRGDFNREAAVTSDGRRVRIVDPGKWNLLGGPDFRAARFAIGDERETTGDVEVHLRAGDWEAHGHARDRAYDAVALHVVLFPPEGRQVTRGGGGKEIPVLALLPLLHHDLEEYAAEEAVEALAGRESTAEIEALLELAPEARTALLQRHAEARWRQKVHFARLRINRLGWEGACHHTALEILGFRFNRAPMLRIAGRWPFAAWARGEVTPEVAHAAEADAWSVQGVRPANHPRTRLAQYNAWARQRSDWPTRALALNGELPTPNPGEATRVVRRRHQLTAWRKRIAADVCGDAIGGTRFDTWVCDGLLPLLAAQARNVERSAGLWTHWFPGDLPPAIVAALRRLGLFDGRTHPACHGGAQGFIGWRLARER